MKSLDQRLSTFISPFDEDDRDQSDVTKEQYLEYRKDALIEAIGTKNGYQEYDLYLEDVLEELESDDTIRFLTRCLDKLTEVYPLDVLIDHVKSENIIEENTDVILSFIKFFVYDSFIYKIAKHLPKFEINDLKDRKTISKKIKDSYFRTQEEIIKDVDIHPLVRYHFKYCPSADGVKTLAIFIFRDLPGVISAQLVQNIKEN